MTAKARSLSPELVLSKIKKLKQGSSSKTSHLRRKTDLLRLSSGNQSSLPTRKIPVGLCRRSADLMRCVDLSDADLIKVIHKQNREAYKELFTRYQKKLFTYIFHLIGNKDEAEDILQNVFSKTYRNIENFDTSRKFSSWIYRIAHNESVNFLKKRSKRHTVSWDDITTSKDKLDTATNDELIEDKWMHQEIIREVDEAIGKLSEKYQKVLKLRYFQEYSYEEIGIMLGKPVNTIGTLINRAKKNLLEIVKNKSKI